MKTLSSFWVLGITVSFLSLYSCGGAADKGLASEQDTITAQTSYANVVLQDYGPDPLVLNIEEYTSANTNFRTVLWTGSNLQVTLMSIPVGGDVGLEQHPDIDQFLRIEQGEGRVMMGESRDSLTFVETAGPDFAVCVPAGKWHNVVNTGDVPLKLYSIYAPGEHFHGTVHKTQTESMEAGHHH